MSLPCFPGIDKKISKRHDATITPKRANMPEYKNNPSEAKPNFQLFKKQYIDAMLSFYHHVILSVSHPIAI